MKAIIIEDEQLTAERLKKLVSQHTSINVVHTLHSVKSAVSWLKEHETPDLIFLDIQLGDGTGFDVLESLKAYPQVIFTTAFDQYIMDAFKYNSVDYLLKPIQADKLVLSVEKLKKVQGQLHAADAFDDLKNHLQSGFRQKFLVKTGLKYIPVRVEQIAYFHSESSTTYLHTFENDCLILDHSLDEVQTLINPTQFFRINRQMIIRDSSLRSIESYFNNRLIVELTPEFRDHVIVSREKVKAFKEWLDR